MPGREAFDIRLILKGTGDDLPTELENTAQPTGPASSAASSSGSGAFEGGSPPDR